MLTPILVQGFLALLEGIALIVSPCILPILPIILSGSLTGSRRRPYGIIVGFVITFSLVTLFTRALVSALHIEPQVLQVFSFLLLILLGVVMLSTRLTEQFNVFTQKLTRVGSSIDSVNDPSSGFMGGLIFGGLIGIVWTPCAGPILAAVIVQSVVQTTTLASVFIVICFALGAGIPMLLIALLGRQLLARIGFLKQHTEAIRKLLGIIIILSVLLLWSGYSYELASTKISNESVTSTQLNALINPVAFPYPGPEIAGINAWINSSPLTNADLRGKVVLIDFWTYSCINCLRTLPYLKAWYAKYHARGFEIIGVHAPEFEFEHDLANVKQAVAKLGILYPVALDNDYVTWRNYQNQFWPAHYLIDKQGNVVYVHFGEGEYDVTENNIRYLLGLNKELILDRNEGRLADQTPETYLGYRRAEQFANLGAMQKDRIGVYFFPQTLQKNAWALQGQWIISAEKIIAESKTAALRLNFQARKVYAVLGITDHPIKVKILLNGQPLGNAQGEDVKDNTILVKEHRLYSLLNFPTNTAGLLELTVEEPGLEIYTFTFG